MKKHIFTTFLSFFCVVSLFAQTPVEGFSFESNNRGYLSQVKISIVEMASNAVKADLVSDVDGRFATALAAGTYRLLATKDLFEDFRDTFTVGDEKTYLKLEMRRKPGYLFDATIAEARENPDQIVDAVSGAWIEIYNRTKGKPELVLRNHPEAFFQHTFEQGNHYTILLRKSGFLAKRIEAYVNVKDCILCIDGVRNMTPGVTENLTEGNKMGTLLSNIEMERVKLDKRIQIQNIYYDYDKWDIRPDAAVRLDNVVQLMRDNPNLTVELGSHTDARGRDEYNLDLSRKRAASAVAYIVEQGIPSERITSKGYGETKLVNRCANGVTCSDQEHEQNRRTELRITGITEYPEEYWTSLEDLIKRETGSGPLSPTQRAALSQKLAASTASSGKNTNKKANTEPEVLFESVKIPEIVPEAPETPAKQEAEKPAAKSVKITNWTPPFFALPTEYTGYGIELAQTTIPLPANAPALMNHPEIYVQQTDNNEYIYYFLYQKRLDEAQKVFQNTIKKQNEGAKIVSFNKGTKIYLK
jgi:outer membrane protein OmpA-like peptidoglycan-associated protein